MMMTSTKTCLPYIQLPKPWAFFITPRPQTIADAEGRRRGGFKLPFESPAMGYIAYITMACLALENRAGICFDLGDLSLRAALRPLQQRPTNSDTRICSLPLILPSTMPSPRLIQGIPPFPHETPLTRTILPHMPVEQTCQPRIPYIPRPVEETLLAFIAHKLVPAAAPYRS